MSQLDKFNKKWGASIKRAKEDNKKKYEDMVIKEKAKQREEDKDHTAIDHQIIKDALVKQEITFKEAVEDGVPVVYLDAINSRGEEAVIIQKAFLQFVLNSYATREKELVAQVNQPKQEEMEEMNEQQLRNIIRDEINGQANIQLKIEQERTRQLELQLELAKLRSAAPSIEDAVMEAREVINAHFEHGPEGKVEEVEDIEIIEYNYDFSKIPYLSTPLSYRKGLGVNWKKVKADGQFERVLTEMIDTAREKGIDPENGKAFKELTGPYNGAYQQFMNDNKGVKGAWKQFVQENLGQGVTG